MNNDTWIWTDELVAEYSLTNQKMTLFEFKRFVQEREQSKQKVVDNKDWIVLALKAEYGGHKDVGYNYNSATKFYVPEYHQFGYGSPNWTLQDVINNHKGQIVSVKRLSDNSTFSIGDNENTLGSIVKFTIEPHPYKLGVKTLVAWNGNNYKTIEYLKKSKQPLFTEAQKDEIQKLIKSYLEYYGVA